MRNIYKDFFWPSLFFTGLSILFTWPLAAHLFDSVIGIKGDNLYYVWLIGWFQKALLALHSNPLIVPTHNYPYGWDLAYTEVTLANVIPVLPFSLFSNPIFAYNLALLLSFVLTGLFMYFWVSSLTASRSAGLFAGTLFAIAPYRIAHAYGHMPLFGTQYLVLHFWGLSYLVRKRSLNWKYAALTGLGLGLAALSSMYYLYMTLIVSALFILVYVLLVERKLFFRSSFWKNGFAALLFSLPLILIAMFPYLQLSGQGNSTHRALALVDEFSASPLDFFLPSGFQLFWRQLGAQMAGGELAIERSLYLGMATLIFASIAVVKRREISPLSLVMVFFVTGLASVVLAMGTTLHWGGQPVLLTVPAFLHPWISRDQLPIPLPNLLLFNNLPFYDSMRAWMRYGVYASLFASLLAGIGFGWVAGKMSSPAARKILFAAVLVLALVDLFPNTLPLTRLEVRPIDRWLASQPGKGAFVQFPIKISLQSETIYSTLFNDKPFLGMFPGAYLPKSFRQQWRDLRGFPSEASTEILRDRQIQYVIVDQYEYDDWPAIAKQIASLGMRELEVIGQQHIFELANPK